MKAIVLDQTGGPDVLKVTDIPNPEPTEDEILVKVKYSGINYADLLSRKGLYSWAPEKPYILGLEAAGEVKEIGANVKDVKIGDRVIYGGQKGGYAEYITIHKDFVLNPPSHLNWEESAAFGVQWFTAWVSLHEMARVREEEILLVHSAAGGVGTAAVQLGIIHNMEVYGTSSKPHKRARVEELGAHAFDYDEFDTELIRMDKRPNCVLETVGGEIFRRSFDILSPLGRIVLIGASGIKINKWNPISWIKAWRDLPKAKMSDVLRKSRGFMGIHLGYLLADPERLRPSWNDMIEVVENHKLRPEVSKEQIFPMSEVSKAHQLIDNRKNIGKVLLDPSR